MFFFMKIFKKILLIILLLLAIVLSALFGESYYDYYKARQSLPVVDVIEKIRADTVHYVEYQDIDEDLIKAVVATEDRRFFQREGIDFIALGRALFRNLEARSLIEGGSTITQQLIQNVYFSFDNNLIDKFAEYFFIYDFEDAYTKEEILEMYLNIINFGDGNFGVYAASMDYFGKDPSDLTIYEASLLAGIPNSPANYQLSNNNPKTYERQRHVLQSMLQEGYIDKSAYDEALALQPSF